MRSVLGVRLQKYWNMLASILAVPSQNLKKAVSSEKPRHFEHVQDGGQKWQKANFAFAKAELQSALVTFVARSLEVELLNPLGEVMTSSMFAACVGAFGCRPRNKAIQEHSTF